MGGVIGVVLKRERNQQIDRLGDDQFATVAVEALADLEERYGVTTPIEDRTRELTNRYDRGLEVLQARDVPAVDPGLDLDEVRDRAAYPAEYLVRRDGETVSLMEK